MSLWGIWGIWGIWVAWVLSGQYDLCVLCDPYDPYRPTSPTRLTTQTFKLARRAATVAEIANRRNRIRLTATSASEAQMKDSEEYKTLLQHQTNTEAAVTVARGVVEAVRTTNVVRYVAPGSAASSPKLPTGLRNRPATPREQRRNSTIGGTGLNQCNDVSDCSHIEYVCHVFAPLATGLLKGA